MLKRIINFERAPLSWSRPTCPQTLQIQPDPKFRNFKQYITLLWILGVECLGPHVGELLTRMVFCMVHHSVTLPFSGSSLWLSTCPLFSFSLLLQKLKIFPISYPRNTPSTAAMKPRSPAVVGQQLCWWNAWTWFGTWWRRAHSPSPSSTRCPSWMSSFLSWPKTVIPRLVSVSAVDPYLGSGVFYLWYRIRDFPDFGSRIPNKYLFLRA